MYFSYLVLFGHDWAETKSNNKTNNPLQKWRGYGWGGKKVTPIFVNFFDGYMAWPYFHHKRLQNFFKRPQKYIVMNRQDCLEAEKISCRQKYK